MVVHIANPRDPLRLAGCECPACGYELKGVSSPTCPECGESFSIDEVRNIRSMGDESPKVIGFLIWLAIAVGFFGAIALLFTTDGGGLMGCFLLGIGVVAMLIPIAWDMLS